VRSNAAKDWKEKTLVDAAPAERLPPADGSDVRRGPQALPKLFDEVDDDDKTRVQPMPSELLRAARRHPASAPPIPSDSLIPLIVVDDDFTDGAHPPEVSNSGVRIQAPKAPSAKAHPARAARPRVLLVAVVVLVALATVSALLVLR
jgi:hypothetical protein